VKRHRGPRPAGRREGRPRPRGPSARPAPIDFPLAGAPLELGALLKVVGICGTGGEAKHLVQGGHVRVDGRVETRRGRKLYGGESVEAKDRTVRVTGSVPRPPAPRPESA
jgi:ribosome-associated protein